MKNIITLKDTSGTDVEFKLLDQFTYDKRTYVVLMPHKDKRVDCIFPQRGAVLGKITAYKKARYYGIATNEVLEPKI